MNLTRQLNNRQIGKAPSQLGEQTIPIYGDKDTATSETKPLTWRLAHHEAVLDLATYESLKGFDGLKIAMTKTPKEVGDMIKDANVRGRGGAGFNAGLKWTFMTPPDGGPRYLICNADEMEPGTFKDRLLMERLPFQLIEGMIITAYAIGANAGYIFIRGEYIEAAKRLNNAIKEAIDAGYLGKNICGKDDFHFELHVHTGAGRYICGEETALINSLEGRRANPRTKPPFPQVSGAWGRPTVVNNVESLNNMPAILLHGVDWYKGLGQGKTDTPGTKIMGCSGLVNEPGLWEVPFFTTAREIIFNYAKGMKDGRKLKAWLPGGASTDFLTASDEHLDLPMDFDPIMKAGSRLGTCLIMVVDESQDMVALSLNLQKFFARESCGWCTPCRDGLPWGVKTLTALDAGQGQPVDIQVLQQLTKDLWLGKTFCAHAPGAVEPLQSALKYFMPEFEAKMSNAVIVEQLSPTGVPSKVEVYQPTNVQKIVKEQV